MEIDGIEVPFRYECGSKQWPSNDPEDNPWSKYVCELCKGEIPFQEFGSFPIGFNAKENVIPRLKWHFENCPKRKK